MARAKRHYIPNQIWHITQRCHKREFLLKFKRDRHRWIQWLFEAKRRFGLVVLNYVVTSNHIHLLLKDDSDHRTIPPAMGLIAGKTAPQYNQRKKRNGAFWQDRCHATAIETGKHSLRCLVYIDLNMVFAGVVDHPSQCPHGGRLRSRCQGEKISSSHAKDFASWLDSKIMYISFQPIANGFKPPWKRSTPNGKDGGRKVLLLAAARLSNVLKRPWEPWQRRHESRVHDCI